MRFALVLVVGALLLAGCATDPPATTTTTTTPSATSTTPTPAGDGKTITVETTKGTFVFELNYDAAPETSAHIAELVGKGFYDGIPFHRYVADFVIQGGDPNCKDGHWKDKSFGCGSGGSGQKVRLETSPDATHVYGAVGLARSSAPDSGDSQFYVVNNEKGDHALDGSYCVFGLVTSGMDVVMKLREGDVMTRVTIA